MDFFRNTLYSISTVAGHLPDLVCDWLAEAATLAPCQTEQTTSVNLAKHFAIKTIKYLLFRQIHFIIIQNSPML